jgi:hypothetical protein
MNTFHLAQEMCIIERESRETNTHADRKSQKLVYNLFLLLVLVVLMIFA